MTAADAFFESMSEQQYPLVWSLLSRKSQTLIVREVFRSSDRYTPDQIETDFRIGGLVSRSYWNAFLNNFDPDIVLEESRWSIGYVKADKAELLISYKKSDNPARLRLFKENGKWKIGLIESFGTGRRHGIYDYLHYFRHEGVFER